MAKSDQEEAYDRLLGAALARTMDMLKFGEAKNAALLTFSSAWMLGAINLLAAKGPLPLGYDSALKAALPLFGTAAAIALYSFLPRLQVKQFLRRPIENPALNLLFFGDAASLSVERADRTLQDAYMPPQGKSVTPRYLGDLSAQLVINGRIARRKHRLFAAGAWLVVLALVVLLIPTGTAILSVAGAL